jgi:hypothetical protein
MVKRNRCDRKQSRGWSLKHSRRMQLGRMPSEEMDLPTRARVAYVYISGRTQRQKTMDHSIVVSSMEYLLRPRGTPFASPDKTLPAPNP